MAKWNFLCIASCIVGLCTQSPQVVADEYQTAIKKLGSAYYKYSDLDDRMKEIERQYLPSDLKKHAGTILFIVKLTTERQVTFKWSFE